MPPHSGPAGFPAPGAVPDEEWDAFLTRCPFAHHEQSSAFADNREGFGFLVERVTTRAAGVITCGAQVLVRRTALGKLASVQRGPVALGDDAEILREVARDLALHAAEQGYRALRIDLFPHQAAARDALQAAGFAPLREFPGMPSASVPLDGSEQDLLKRMSSRVGREVRRATEKGVEVRTGHATLADFHALYQRTSAHHGFPSFPLAYFEALWSGLGAAGRLQAFVAYVHDRPLAGILNSVVGDEMYFGWGGMSRAPEDKALRANFLLHWSAILSAQRQRLRRYDLAGESPFKAWFELETSEWPAPLWKLRGTLGHAQAKALAPATRTPAVLSPWRPLLRRLIAPPTMPQ